MQVIDLEEPVQSQTEKRVYELGKLEIRAEPNIYLRDPTLCIRAVEVGHAITNA